jgi:enoyl-CoA hydratase/carnithine racemase
MQLIRATHVNGIVRLMLDDNARRNALSMDMLGQLQSALDQAAVDSLVRVIVIAATGPAFCSGHDLKEITRARESTDGGKAFFVETMATCERVMQTIVSHSKPVIAEVTGVALAAGCQSVASCDLAYAATTARFGTPGVNIELFCSTPMVALTRNISNKSAMEMLLCGDLMDAETAGNIGLINGVVPEETLSDYTMNIAAKIAAKSRTTLAIGKREFYLQREMPPAQTYEYTSQIMVANMLERDAEEGINAFIEKRAPHWVDQ